MLHINLDAKSIKIYRVSSEQNLSMQYHTKQKQPVCRSLYNTHAEGFHSNFEVKKNVNTISGFLTNITYMTFSN